MWPLEAIGAVATVLAIGGVLLNNRRVRACFYLWMISNALSAALHAHAGFTALLVRDLVFLLLSIEGLWRWRRKARADDA